MPNFQSHFVGGHVGKDPEGGTDKNGSMWARFSMATNSGPKDEKKTEWWEVVCFKGTAERVLEHLKKGDGVIVDGYDVEANAYMAGDGSPRASLKMKARAVHQAPPMKLADQDGGAPAGKGKDDDLPF